MRLISGKNLINKKPIAATIGFFDGVHLGHRYLIEQVKTVAKLRNIPSAVVTFNEHPRKVVQPDYVPELLTSTDERLKLLEESGIDICIVLDFDASLAQLSALEFLENVLKKQLSVEALVIGYDHRFGKNRTDNYDDYVRYGNSVGIKTTKAEALQIDGENVSSSIIRKMVLSGQIEEANHLLSHPYTLLGTVVEGQKLGRTIGFPTANIQPTDSNKIIPSNGVYVVAVTLDENRLYGMLNIGLRPTIAENLQLTIEVNLFDFDDDIYHQSVEVEFLHKLRNERKMSGLNELKAQLFSDKEQALHFITKKG
ncbi:MAG: riboflavin biosynthesis protein RibF [Bacteroidales bacterium]